MSNVYWIHHPDHTDIFSQGYIGVTKDIKKRWSDHQKRSGNVHLARAIKKYGWDNLIKEVVLIADRAYCLMIETQLRPENKIGWNITQGGGDPPHINVWNKGKTWSDEIKARISMKKMGVKHAPEVAKILKEHILKVGMNTRFKKGMVSPNKGKKQLPHVIEAVRKASLGRVHSEEEKAKRAKSLMGHIVTEETRRKISESNLNKPKLKCSYCDTFGNIGSLTRWHMNNCKFKETQ